MINNRCGWLRPPPPRPDAFSSIEYPQCAVEVRHAASKPHIFERQANAVRLPESALTASVRAAVVEFTSIPKSKYAHGHKKTFGPDLGLC